MKYPKIPAKMKFKKEDLIIHKILLGTGNVTACGLRFKNIMGAWTKNFTTDTEKVDCPDCIKITEKMKKDYELHHRK
mgnify:CR=1 FL=1